MITDVPFDYDRVLDLSRQLLQAIGENPDRPGLVDTPRRIADFWKEFILYNPGNCETTFEVEEIDQMVVISGIRVYSLCEHHLLPFFVDISIGYLTQEKVIGLSKFGRISQMFAHRLQLQERLVKDIAQEVITLAGHNNVGVIGSGEHLCMTMRGIKTPSIMISSALYGKFRDNPDVRREFLNLKG